jgi:Ca2+-binding RTX toxin-like protein
MPGVESMLSVGSGLADDHVNLATTSDGTVYAAVKTGFDRSTLPEIGLLKRDPWGQWDPLYEVDNRGTRPIVVVSEAADRLFVFYTSSDSGGDIQYRESPLGNIAFGPVQIMLDGDLNNATATKNAVSDELLVLASTSSSVWGKLVSLGHTGNPINQAPQVFAGNDSQVEVDRSLHLVGIVSDDGQPNPPGNVDTSWTVVSGPGSASFVDASLLETSVSFNTSGSYVLRLTADDGDLAGFDDILVEVTARPELNEIADLHLDMNPAVQLVTLTGISAGGGDSQPLRVTASSSNTGLIPNPMVTYTSADTTGSLSFAVVADTSGTATITVTVEDGGFDGDLGTVDDNATFSREFDVFVNATPTLDVIGDLIIDEDGPEQTLNLTGITAGGGESQPLRVTAASSNTGLISNQTIVGLGDLADGLVAHYPFSGNSLDATGNGQDATVMGASLSGDRFGGSANAYDFNDGGDIIVQNDASLMPADDEEFALSLWVNPRQLSGDHRVLVANQSLDQFQLGIASLRQNRMEMYLGGARVLETDALMWELDRWYHVAVTRQGDRISLYRDGSVLAAATTAASITASPEARRLSFGARNDAGGDGSLDHPWIGRLDDIRVYNRSLSTNEVENLYFFESGRRTLTLSPVADANGTATITVTVEDGGVDRDLETTEDNAMFSRTFDVNVLSVEDIPVIVSPNARTLPESATSVFDVQIDDPDVGQAHFYVISGGVDQQLFAIDFRTGSWGFISPPDFENPADSNGDNVYELEIKVYDAADHVDMQRITVTVTDENEAPVFDLLPSSVSHGGTAVGIVTATDQDLPAQTVVYGIDGGADATEFTIDPATGLLSFVSVRDFSAPADSDNDNVYEVTVTADDQAGGVSSQLLQITVVPPFEFNDATGELILTAIDGVLIVDRDERGSISLNGGATSVSAGDVVTLWLIGSEEADIIDAGRLRPSDIPNAMVIIEGLGGDDVIMGSRNSDLIDAGDGNDVVIGNWGDDTIQGGDGDDTIIGAAGNDFLDGGSGADNLHGNSGHDVVNGDGGDDVLRGSSGNDTMSGGDGDDTLLGSAGDDLLSGNTGNDVVDGGNGVNQLSGDEGDDRLRTDGQATLSGGAGHDLISGSSLDDRIMGDDGNDTAYGGAGDDRLDGGNGEDFLVGDDGNDRLSGNLGNDTLDGSAGDDTMFGGSQVDVLIGQQGNDRADGGGGTGDIFQISSENARFSSDISIMADEAVAGSERDSFAGIERVEVYLDDLPQFVDGRAFSGRVVVDAGGGNDTILTGDGADLIFAGAGDDLVDTGNGNDIVYAGSGDDAVHGRAGVDRLNGQGNNDTILGGDGDDFLFGGGGRDIVLGEAGTDRVSGNSGADTLAGSGNGTELNPGDVLVDDPSEIDETFSFHFDTLLEV